VVCVDGRDAAGNKHLHDGNFFAYSQNCLKSSRPLFLSSLIIIINPYPSFIEIDSAQVHNPFLKKWGYSSLCISPFSCFIAGFI
jgi:hypothetical protein